ncbi:MAG: nucleotidyltransferase domain-containing protein [archaeon]
MNKLNQILTQVLENVEPPKEDLKFIEDELEKFLQKLRAKIKSLRINVEIFVGGSFAKKTLIKKDKYDIDIFLRFDKKYKNEELSDLTKKLLNGFKEVSMVHGSRDYFNVKLNPFVFFEIVPVAKIKKLQEAENITDLSYSHVKYVNRKVKSKKVLDEIRVAKAFCYANNCYGAESYINGFSGYGLELLVYSYGSFLKFIRAIVKSKKDEKIVIDIEKQHKNKSSILMDLNSSKLQSPIVLIDPTYKQRNVLAALSYETFEKFKKECVAFLKTPSIKSFEVKKTDLEKVKKDAKMKKFEFVLVEAFTNKQEGDIAGGKLLKFYKHLEMEISKYFEMKKKGFNYNHKKSARYFFVVKSKKELLVKGPFVKDEKNEKRFKKKHKKTFVKKNQIYSREKIDFDIKKFIEIWKKKNKTKIKEMDVVGLKVFG